MYNMEILRLPVTLREMNWLSYFGTWRRGCAGFLRPFPEPQRRCQKTRKGEGPTLENSGVAVTLVEEKSAQGWKMPNVEKWLHSENFFSLPQSARTRGRPVKNCSAVDLEQMK